MRSISRVIALIILAWIIWIGYQYFTKSKTANKILEQQVRELGLSGFDALLQEMGGGYKCKEIEIGGERYWLGWIVLQPGMSERFSAFHIDNPCNKAYLPAKIRGDLSMLEVEIYVDYIDLLPFGYFKAGSSWVLRMKR